MASNLRVDTILPSTGTTLGIGTASGTINFLGNSNIVTSGTLTAASASITGNLGVGGTLTYEDVTNIDSVGVITARSGINITSGRLLIGTTTEGNAGADDLTIATSGDTGMTIRSGTSHAGSIYFADGVSGNQKFTLTKAGTNFDSPNSFIKLDIRTKSLFIKGTQADNYQVIAGLTDIQTGSIQANVADPYWGV